MARLGDDGEQEKASLATDEEAIVKSWLTWTSSFNAIAFYLDIAGELCRSQGEKGDPSS